MDVLADGEWERVFTEKPEVFTKEEKRAWLDKNTDVALGSDASSHLVTILREHTRAVLNILHSRVVQSVMTM